MLEFIFFHHDVCKLFTEFVAKRHVVFSIGEDGDTITVSIAEDEDDDLIEQVENEYDRLLDLSRERTDSDEGESSRNYQKASLLITLKNGEKSYAHVDTDLVNRILNYSRMRTDPHNALTLNPLAEECAKLLESFTSNAVRIEVFSNTAAPCRRLLLPGIAQPGAHPCGG